MSSARSHASRRGFLVTGAGAAAVGLTVLAPGEADAAPAVPAKTLREHESGTPLVALVGDARSGEISLMVGEREVVVHDRRLVARLLAAASA